MTKKLTKDADFGKAKPTTIGERIKWLRGEETRKAFCEKINIAVNTLINYENDARVPDAKLIARICKACKISADWLICGEPVEACDLNISPKKTTTNIEAIPHTINQNTLPSPSGKKGWALNLGLEEFEELWDEYRGEREGRRGWLQVEVINRFPEFIEWLEQRQAPLKPGHIAALKKGGQLTRFGPPDQPDDD